MVQVIKVKKSDTSIIKDILAHHLDDADRKNEPPVQSHIEQLLEDDRTYLYAATVDGTVGGYTLAYRFPSLYASQYLAYLYDIEVAPPYRRKGIGRLLIQTLLTGLKKDSVKEVWLGTALDNIEGQGFFGATGAFKSKETFNDYTYYL